MDMSGKIATWDYLRLTVKRKRVHNIYLHRLEVEIRPTSNQGETLEGECQYYLVPGE
jgi:hypothetical protein